LHKQNRAKDTGLAVTLIFLLITWLTSNITWVMPAIISLVLAMTVPAVFTHLSIVWFGLANVIGQVVSTIILTILFFSVLMPIGIFRRICGFDSLSLKKWKNSDPTVFDVRDRTFCTDDLEKPY
jgi:polyferredoxin